MKLQRDEEGTAEPEWREEEDILSKTGTIVINEI